MTEEAKTILAKLPGILRESPELRSEVYRILSEEFVPRREMAEILAEMKSSREEARERFEAMDRRFEAIQKQMDRRFEDLLRIFRDHRRYVDVAASGLGRRVGRGLEETVAGALRFALEMEDLDPETIQLRREVTDEEGLIGPAGRTYEYDIFVTDGRTCVFEVKSMPDREDVDRFRDKCDLVAQALGLEEVRRVLVTLAKWEGLAERCEARGVELV